VSSELRLYRDVIGTRVWLIESYRPSYLQAWVLSGTRVTSITVRRGIALHLVNSVNSRSEEMPDAYENINMAMRSLLTASVIADNEDSYFQFNGNARTAVPRARLHPKCARKRVNTTVAIVLLIHQLIALFVLTRVLTLGCA